MQARVRALLVHDEERPVAELKPLLELQGIETTQARSCAEAESALACVEPPALIFTDTVLCDGTWTDVQSLVEHMEVPVIVVSRFVDLPVYLDVLESGAADFIVPPFRETDVAWVVESALLRDTVRAPSVSSRAITGIGFKGAQHAQNHTASGAWTAHAQAGR